MADVCPRCERPLPPASSCHRCLLETLLEDDSPFADVPDLSTRGIELEEALGEGGMGRVFLGRQVELDRPVAVKLLAEGLADERGFADRFRHEARILANLGHPRIVGIHDFGFLDDTAFLVMEHVPGGNLRDRLRAGPLEPAEALRIAGQLAEALAAAHAAGVVHRDLKPENVLFDVDGQVKLADFGLARELGDATRHTRTGALLGTPQYMSPEQLEGAPDVDERADVYALGVLLYEMVTGRPPVGSFAAASRVAPVPAELDRVIDAALQPDRNERIASAAELRSRLARVAAPSASKGARLGGRRRWVTRRATSALVMLAALFLAMPLAYLWSVDRPESGWTSRRPDAPVRRILVSSSGGDDENDGQHAPLATIAAAVSRLNDGEAGQLLLRRGDVFREPLGYWTHSGRSHGQPLLIGAYGELEDPRPLLEISESAMVVGVDEIVSHLLIADLHLRATSPDARGLSFFGRGEDVRIEGVQFEGFALGVFAATEQLERLTIHRSQFVDGAGGAPPRAGALVEGVKGLTVSQCIFEHNGWHSEGEADETSAALWVEQETSDVVVEDCLFSRSASKAIKAWSGGEIRGNLIVGSRGGIVFGPWGTWQDDIRVAPVTGVVEDNLVIASSSTPPAFPGLVVGHVSSLTVTSTVISHPRGGAPALLAALETGSGLADVHLVDCLLIGAPGLELRGDAAGRPITLRRTRIRNHSGKLGAYDQAATFQQCSIAGVAPTGIDGLAASSDMPESLESRVRDSLDLEGAPWRSQTRGRWDPELTAPELIARLRGNGW